MLDFLSNALLFFLYLDGLMFKFWAQGMSIFGIMWRLAPLSVIGIAGYFGFLEGFRRFTTRFITRPINSWLKRKEWRWARNAVAFFKRRRRRNHRRRKKINRFFAARCSRIVAIFPDLMLVLTFAIAFIMNLLPLPYLTLLTVVIVKLTGRGWIGFAVVTAGSIAKIPFVLVGIPWLYHLIR